MKTKRLAEDRENLEREINQYYKENTWSKRFKDSLPHLSNEQSSVIRKLFCVSNDVFEKDKYSGEEIITTKSFFWEHLFYLICSFFINASLIKLGIDFNNCFYIWGTLVFQLIINIFIFKWEGIVTNFVVYILAIMLTYSSTYNALMNDTYHNAAIKDTTELTLSEFINNQIYNF